MITRILTHLKMETASLGTPWSKCELQFWNPLIYNIICWVAWRMGQTNRRPRLWYSKYFFFHDFLQNSLQKSFQFISYLFYKITKIRSFECPKSIKSIKINNTWNIRLLVDDSFFPSSKQPSVIYCRLTGFWTLSTLSLNFPHSWTEPVKMDGGLISYGTFKCFQDIFINQLWLPKFWAST